jgi:hypothetical protein
VILLGIEKGSSMVALDAEVNDVAGLLAVREVIDPCRAYPDVAGDAVDDAAELE